jgi:CRP/FNR family transcriptional regulator, cyclic AMP receptor protein
MTTYAFPVESILKGSKQFGNVGAGSFCKNLAPEALSEFGSITTCSSCAAGSEIYGEDQIPARVFILLQGQVKVSISARSGRRLILRIAKPGEVLGLSSAFSGNFYEETAQAISPCNLISLRCPDFAAFLVRHPSAFHAVMREFGVQYEQACARLRMTGMTLSVAAKLARLLLEWASSAQQTEYGIRIHVTYTWRNRRVHWHMPRIGDSYLGRNAAPADHQHAWVDSDGFESYGTGILRGNVSPKNPAGYWSFEVPGSVDLVGSKWH